MTIFKINPKTGMTETVGHTSVVDDGQADLQRARRETKDVIAGNVQFHADDLGPAPIDTRPAFDRSKCECKPYWAMGQLCEYCASGDYNPRTVK